MQSPQKNNKGIILTLPGKIRINNNSPLIKRFVQILNSGYEKIMMDFSAVTEIDLSSIQIIISFCKTAYEKNINIIFSGPIKKDVEEYLQNSGFLRKNSSNESIMFPFFENKGVRIGNRRPDKTDIY